MIAPPPPRRRLSSTTARDPDRGRGLRRSRPGARWYRAGGATSGPCDQSPMPLPRRICGGWHPSASRRIAAACRDLIAPPPPRRRLSSTTARDPRLCARNRGWNRSAHDNRSVYDYRAAYLSFYAVYLIVFIAAGRFAVAVETRQSKPSDVSLPTLGSMPRLGATRARPDKSFPSRKALTGPPFRFVAQKRPKLSIARALPGLGGV
jgi:hypothetical protein